MKSKITAFIMAVWTAVFLIPAFAASPSTGVPSEDPYHATGVYNTKKQTVSPMATGLISSVSADMYLHDGNVLHFIGITNGTQILNKIGFKKITLQRYQNGAWINVTQREYYETNTDACVCNWDVAVAKGYDYRFTCTHLRKKTG